MRRRFTRNQRPTTANNAIDEGRNLAGLGELSEDLLKERRTRPPILTPRGLPPGMSADSPFAAPLAPPPPPPATRNYNPQALTTYTVEVPAGVAIPVFAQSRERSYCIIINSGANAAVLTYGRAPVGINDGIPLAASGVGFHELTNGTTSTAFAFATTATFLTVTEGRFDPAMNA